MTCHSSTHNKRSPLFFDLTLDVDMEVVTKRWFFIVSRNYIFEFNGLRVYIVYVSRPIPKENGCLFYVRSEGNHKRLRSVVFSRKGDFSFKTKTC